MNLQHHETGVMIDSPFTECLKFKTCSINNCPLHPSYPDLPMCPEDPAKKCMLSKAKRVTIGDRHQGVLRFDGMTKAEFGRTRSWAQRSAESRQRSITAGTKNLHERHFLADLTENTKPRLNSGVNMGRWRHDEVKINETRRMAVERVGHTSLWGSQCQSDHS